MIKVGDTVYLKIHAKRKVIPMAKVTVMLDDIEGGVKLDLPLEGYRYWNVDDLEVYHEG